MAHNINSNPVYEDYDPPSDVVTEQGCDTILIYLPGYKKDQLRFQLTTSRILKISGQRPINDNRWRRFHKEFQVPTNCNTKEISAKISAKFEGGILHIRQPKLITPPVPAAPDQPALVPDKTPAEPPKTLSQQQQPQPHASSQPRPQKGFEEEKMRSNDDSKEDAVEKEKSEITKNDEQGKEDQCGWKERPKQVGGNLGFFRGLKKPENLKRLAVSVVIVLSIGFYVTYMFKSNMGMKRKDCWE